MMSDNEIDSLIEEQEQKEEEIQKYEWMGQIFPSKRESITRYAPANVKQQEPFTLSSSSSL